MLRQMQLPDIFKNNCKLFYIKNRPKILKVENFFIPEIALKISRTKIYLLNRKIRY